jgi:hypothetical protein
MEEAKFQVPNHMPWEEYKKSRWIQLVCTHCERSFLRRKCYVERRYCRSPFCSKACLSTEMKERYGKPKNSPPSRRRFLANQLRLSSKYAIWRKHLLAKYPFCLIIGTQEELETHHIFPIVFFPEMAYDIENGLVLTRVMHKRFHQLAG